MGVSPVGQAWHCLPDVRHILRIIVQCNMNIALRLPEVPARPLKINPTLPNSFIFSVKPS
jgi:hypothetical protein